MKTFTFILSFFLAGFVHAASTAEEILLKSDTIRIPQSDYTVHVKIADYKPKKKKPKVSSYKVYGKRNEKSLVQTLTPAVDRGRLLLMNGNNYWGYLPNVSKPLRISLQEKLTGEVSNGDLSRANFTGDYTPEVLKTESINGENHFVLDLKAKTEDVTYGQVKLWVNKKNFRPLKAEFYSFSGRLLKTCLYKNYKSIGGTVRPNTLEMVDAVRKGKRSVLDYSEMKVAPIPEKYFSKNYMKRIK